MGARTVWGPSAGEDGGLVPPTVFKIAVSLGNLGQEGSIPLLSRHFPCRALAATTSHGPLARDVGGASPRHYARALLCPVGWHALFTADLAVNRPANLRKICGD